MGRGLISSSVLSVVNSWQSMGAFKMCGGIDCILRSLKLAPGKASELCAICTGRSVRMGHSAAHTRCGGLESCMWISCRASDLEEV